ncbi:hypothetical protein JCM6882_009312 [Rhodosporidiobolus microsporus]
MAPSTPRRALALALSLALLSLLLAASPASASFASARKNALSSSSDDGSSAAYTYGGQRIVPGRFLIEVENGWGERLVKRAGGAVALLDNVLTHLASPPPSSSSSSSSSSTQKGAFNLTRLTLPSLSPLRTFAARPTLFTGAVVEIVDQGEVEKLRAWPLRLISRPVPVTRDGLPASSGSLSSASALSSLLSSSGSKSKRATVDTSATAYANDTFGPHVMTGVDKLHAQGKLGSGVKIGVIDTGVDYKNPLLGGCFGPSCPVSFGASFVGSTSSSPSSSDPYTDCTDHGTHVTGIIAARANSLGFSGVAPQATVGHYRIFDCEQSTSEDVVVSALLAASEDDCDVVSLSLGSNVGWLDASPSQLLVDRMTQQEGRVVVVSAGNDQAEGLFFANSPAATVSGISVGSVDVTELPAYPLTVLSPRLTIPYLSPSPLDLSSLPTSRTGYRLYFTSSDPAVVDDACGALPASTPDLSDRVVVIKRGTCTFDEKLSAVQDRGAKIVLVYNSPTSGNMIPYLDTTYAPGLVAVASLRYEEGARLLELYNSRPRGVYVSFPQGEGVAMVRGVEDTEDGGVVSYFSEFGPTFELVGQPSLTAPGGNILSTFPVDMGGVGVISGTSMACPFVSGSVALLLSEKKALGVNLSPLEVRALLATTAKRTATEPNGAVWDTVLLQGGGLVQVDKAISTGTVITPFQLALNDTTYFTRTQTLTIRNTNKVPLLYTFSTAPIAAQGVATYDTSASADVVPSLSPPSVSGTNARVSFSTRALLVPAGTTGKVTVTIQAPRLSRTQIARFPFYSGWIEVTGRGGAVVDQMSVSYFGLAARMVDMPVLDTSATIYGDVAYPFIASGFNYQTEENSYGWTTGFDIYTRLAAGTRFASIDLISADTPFTATIPSARATEDSSSSTSRFARLRKRSPLAVDLSVSTSPSSSSSSSSSLLSSFAVNASLSLASTSPSSTTAKLYSDTPVLGTIQSGTLLPRDYLVDNTPLPYSETVTNFVPSEAGFATSLTYGDGKKYRVLIRALKITADPSLESSYESYVSFPFTLTA